MGVSLVMQCGGKAHRTNRHNSTVNGFLKRLKARAERRRVRRDPETCPGYKRYNGWAD